MSPRTNDGVPWKYIAAGWVVLFAAIGWGYDITSQLAAINVKLDMSHDTVLYRVSELERRMTAVEQLKNMGK